MLTRIILYNINRKIERKRTVNHCRGNTCHSASLFPPAHRQLVSACRAGNLEVVKRVAISHYHPYCSPLALAMSGSMFSSVCTHMHISARNWFGEVVIADPCVYGYIIAWLAPVLHPSRSRQVWKYCFLLCVRACIDVCVYRIRCGRAFADLAFMGIDKCTCALVILPPLERPNP